MSTYKKHLTNEFIDAIDMVCGACPYISEGQITDELANQMGLDDDAPYDSGEKYCERCMVRHMYELFYAEDKNGDYLPMSAPEWQAIINY